MKLSQLLSELSYTLLSGSLETDITALCCDSRLAGSGSLFVALPGARADGHDYVSAVCKAGAAAVVVERPVPAPEGVAVIQVDNTRTALAELAAAFYGRPADKLTIIGITGTKGKTTTAYILRSILTAAGYKTGMIGTVGTFIGEEMLCDARNTTPESLELHQRFAQMLDAGCTHVVMEVSSQAMKLHRVHGIEFDTALFLNLSPDHIGAAEHADFDEYRACKAALFAQCRKAVGNFDDENWHIMRSKTRPVCAITTFGFQDGADVRGGDIKPIRGDGLLGSQFTVEGEEEPYRFSLPGAFNVSDALAAIAVSHALGIPGHAIRKGLASTTVRGRTEVYPHPGDYTVLIDYAHNDVSFESILTTLKAYDHNRIIVVFGAGGDRPKMRRADMAREAAKYADFAIITMDNPRTERVEDICADITAALDGKIPSIEIYDRREAIFYALDMAQPGDIIALLGKGHEEYFEINGVRSHFSEREVLDEYFGKKEREV
jgi:UDP-N-acetylmuramoyl-L-alanyl-D-glutamate--2,6-diaminopimelate ligase